MKTQTVPGNTYNSPEKNVTNCIAIVAEVVTAFSVSEAMFSL